MKKILALAILSVFFTACGGGNSSNTTISNQNNTAPKNTNSVTSTANSNAEKPDLANTNFNDEKIRPDENAKFENGKEFSNAYFDVNLPSDWTYKKTSYGHEFKVGKKTDDGVIGFYFLTSFADKATQPYTDKKAMLDREIQSVIKEKAEGRADFIGSYGFSVGNNLVPGTVRVVDKLVTGVDPKTKCTMEILHGCGRYAWTGYVGGENNVFYYFAVMFPPGTYEKNKPTVDAIVRSIKFH